MFNKFTCKECLNELTTLINYKNLEGDKYEKIKYEDMQNYVLSFKTKLKSKNNCHYIYHSVSCASCGKGIGKYITSTNSGIDHLLNMIIIKVKYINR